MLTPICSDQQTLEIEIEYAVREEMALSLDDVLFRRTGLGTIGHPGDAAVERCAEIMAVHLGWDEAEISRQKTAIQRRYSFQ